MATTRWRRWLSSALSSPARLDFPDPPLPTSTTRTQGTVGAASGIVKRPGQERRDIATRPPRRQAADGIEDDSDPIF